MVAPVTPEDSTSSLFICMLLAAAGGVFNVVAVSCLAYPRAQKQKGRRWSRRSLRTALAANIFFQLLNACASISASWFGPVSISVPTSHGANMLFNMIMFGMILRLETIDKDARVGSYVAAVAVVLLPVVGPGVQDYGDITSLLGQPYAVIWTAILFIGMLSSIIGLAIETRRKKRPRLLFAFNLVAQSTAGVLATTFAKMLALAEGPLLGGVIFLTLLSSVVLLSAIVQQAKLVQSVFIPLKTACTIVVNGATGVIVWEDWRVIKSWVGYGCALSLLVLGNYLISDYDVWNARAVQTSLRDLGVIHDEAGAVDSDEEGNGSDSSDRTPCACGGGGGGGIPGHRRNDGSRDSMTVSSDAFLSENGGCGGATVVRMKSFDLSIDPQPPLPGVDGSPNMNGAVAADVSIEIGISGGAGGGARRRGSGGAPGSGGDLREGLERMASAELQLDMETEEALARARASQAVSRAQLLRNASGENEDDFIIDA